MNRSQIEVGQRWGQLVVVEQAESSPSGQSRWLCQCDCGKQSIVISSNLKRGRTVSCGCRKQNNLTGKHIGKLTVLERSDRYSTRGARRVRLWKCQCDCGAITYKATDTLTNKAVNMCRQCAEEYAITRAREKAGFIQGTQVTKINRPSRESLNTTGVRGVYLDKKNGKYRARIKFQGKLYNLGSYYTIEEAAAARREGEQRYFGAFLASIE